MGIIYYLDNERQAFKVSYHEDGCITMETPSDAWEVTEDRYGFFPEQIYNDPQNKLITADQYDAYHGDIGALRSILKACEENGHAYNGQLSKGQSIGTYWTDDVFVYEFETDDEDLTVDDMTDDMLDDVRVYVN